MQVQAAVFRAPHTPFTIETLDLAPPQAGEVLVEMRATGVCHSDWHLVTGATPFPTPCVPGHEGAGIVTEVGDGVTRVRVGDPVCLNWAPHCGHCFYCAQNLPALCETHTPAHWAGTLLDGTTRLSQNGAPVYHFSTTACFATHTVVPQSCCVPLPAAIPFPIAALVGCAVTTGMGAVWNKARVAPGDNVAVFGAGGVGLSSIMAASLAGAGRVIAVDTNAEKLALAHTCGATDGLLAGSDVPDQIRALTHGRGADAVIEAVGIPAAQEQGLDALRPGGILVLAGIAPTASQTNLPGAKLTRQEKTVAGTYYGSGNPSREFPRIAALYQQNRLPLDRLVSRTYALNEINEAYAQMLTGRDARGVVIF